MPEYGLEYIIIYPVFFILWCSGSVGRDLYLHKPMEKLNPLSDLIAGYSMPLAVLCLRYEGVPDGADFIMWLLLLRVVILMF